MNLGQWKNPRWLLLIGLVAGLVIGGGGYAVGAALVSHEQPTATESDTPQNTKGETTVPGPRNSRDVPGGAESGAKPPASAEPTPSKAPRPAATCDPAPKPTPPKDNGGKGQTLPTAYNGTQVVSGCTTPLIGGGSNARVLSKADTIDALEAIRNLKTAKAGARCTKEFRGYFQLVVDAGGQGTFVFNGEGHGCGWVTVNGITYTGGRTLFKIIASGG